MRIIDVTGTLQPGMWKYDLPQTTGIPGVNFEQIANLDEHGYEAHKITLFTISGTYLETAAHVFEGKPSIDEIPPERLITEAAIMKLRKKKRLEPITLEELKAQGVEVRPGDALLVYTGWDEHWNDGDFVRGSPHFTPQSMDWILGKGISILGGDIPCYSDPRNPNIPLVKRLFEKDVLILAPLVNLNQVNKSRVKLIALPLKVKGLCGSPCRALVIEEP